MNAAARLIASAICTIALSGRAAPKVDLQPDRITPVPADQQIPIIDFFRPLLFHHPALNPTGTHFAALITNQEFCVNVLVCDMSTGKITWTDTGHDAEDFSWLDEKNITISYTQWRRYSGTRAYSIIYGIEKLDKKKSREDFFAAKKHGMLSGTDYIYEAEWPDKMPPGIFEASWSLRENGEPGYCISKAGDVRSLYRYIDRHWEKIPVDLEAIEPVDIGEKPGVMIVLGPRQDRKPRAVQRFDTTTGQLGEVLYQDTHYEGVAHIFRRAGSSEVIGVSVPHTAPHALWFDAKHQEVQKLIDRALPGSVAFIRDSDVAENIFFIEEISDRKPPAFFTVNLAKHTLNLVKNSGPWIDPTRSRPMQVFTYKARDGAPIEAFVTMPAGATKEHPCALVVLPHAGPWGRNLWGWNATVQFLVSRGYAVFQPNYRGSEGYDWRFAQEDRWDFGKMHRDVTDGTKALFTTGLIDRQRVAIMGEGFGGYLAICGAVDEPGLYRCAVTLGGVFDWEKAIKEDNEKVDTDLESFRQHFGDIAANREKYAAISPLKRIDQVSIPLFVTNNVTVRDLTRHMQTDKLASAMPVNVRNMIVGDLNLYDEKQFRADLISIYGKIEAFLATNLKPLTSASTAAPVAR